jgi:pyruvate dehydrogenase E1 component beta subunit
MGLGWMPSPQTAATEVPEEAYTIPFGQARVVREGSDVTIVALALMVHRAMEAAEELAKDGISVEIVDPRTLVPFDREAIIESVKKTHRLLVVDEDYKSFGFSGEVAAIVAEHALDYLDTGVRRLAVPDVPIPYSRPLEQFVLPSSEKIVQTVKEMLE